MNKRIIISESEKKRILSQHKSSVQNESELKKQSLSERELSKLVNKVLIQEQLEVPGLPEGMGECIISNLKSIKLGQQMKIATGCKDMDVTNCSKALVSVGLELATQVISNPSILINWGKETMEFANCMSEKFEMNLPIENLAASKTDMKEVRGSGACDSDSQCPRGQRCVGNQCSITTALKETGPCKSNSDCPSNMACYNGKCSVTTSLSTKKPNAKEMKESEEMDEIIYEIELDEKVNCGPGEMECNGLCCPKGKYCNRGMCSGGIGEPTPPHPPRY
jgi:hypothetical protein